MCHGDGGIETSAKTVANCILGQARGWQTKRPLATMDGLGILDHIKSLNRNTRCIVITAYASVENAVAAMKKGAFTYFIKSNDPQELIISLKHIEKMKSLREENELLRGEIGSNHCLMQTNNDEFQKTIEYAEKVAKTDTNVIILGESGVGKEVLARYIHKCSNRNNGIFMPINCHSLSDSLLEAELYGHEKGAFTGAISQRKGRFEAADGGTLFLDEIGDIPITTQSKILRNIERKEIVRIGSNSPIKINFRLICATNRDLNKEIENGRFREDLYYRISTIIIEIPPLRSRKEDLSMLVDYFLMKAGKELKKNVTSMDTELMDVLYQYDYPGNVRELKNIIERIVVIAEKDKIALSDIKQYDIFKKSEPLPVRMSLREVRIQAERNHIIRALESSENDLETVAKNLKITPRQLYNKINEYGIPRHYHRKGK